MRTLGKITIKGFKSIRDPPHFVLKPSRLNESKIRMEWLEKGHEGYFNATSLSDGTLRFICLVTLLLQPDLPGLILLDEPELGLHPAAVALLSDLLISASQRAQILVASQSVTLINHLEPDQVWTVNREEDQSTFHQLSHEDLSAWMDRYALGELWENKELGGFVPIFVLKKPFCEAFDSQLYGNQRSGA
ncbi:MAG: AAA family ATPase [Luteolibacter sp.]|nr:AAA family ATPase [Luteolibacter sp.]